MTPEERQRMDWLCMRIQEEKDHKVFTDLISELNALIAKKNERLEHSGTSKQ